MQSAASISSVEHTSIGRVVVPPLLPEGFALFYTTIDFAGDTRDPRLHEMVGGASIAQCHQVHGRIVGWARAVPDECDALYTTDAGVALAIKVADCLPVTIFDPTHGVTANIHSGWRGAAQAITAATLDVLERETAFDARSSFAWLGPSIRVCCFEVGEEVAVQFDRQWIDRNRGTKPHVDLPALTAALLSERGVANVIDSGLCTRCDGSMFHSYRRDKRGGRNLAIAARLAS